MFRNLGQIGLFSGVVATIACLAPGASAQDLGAPPPEAEKVAAGPGPAPEAPKITTAPEGTTASLSAGGLSSSGNSRS